MSGGRRPLGVDAVAARRAAVWGLGLEGIGVAGLLRARGAHPLLVDDDPVAAAGRCAELGDGPPVVLPGEVDWTAVDVVVRSPGVSRYRPELVAARKAGTEVTTAMALWLADFEGEPTIAVTGTKGKSTTAALAASVLRASGRNVELVGNIGVPVTETYGRRRAGVYVVEVSSYQAADVGRSPEVCVLTCLAPDHLDWHGDLETYYRDKLRLLTAGPPGSGRVAVDSSSRDATALTAGHPNRLLYGGRGRVTVDDGGLVRADGVPLVDTAGWEVAGAHNRRNLCGAVSGVLLLEGEAPTSSAVAEAVASFHGLPSRGQVVGESAGRLFVDDALASNPLATAASVEVFAGRPLTLVAGGADRGVEMHDLAAALVAVGPPVALVAVGAGGARLVEAVGAHPEGGRVTLRRAPTLEEAVEAATELTPEGGVVLFSPAQPTPASEGDYRDRSRRFCAAAGLADPNPPPGRASGRREEASGRRDAAVRHPRSAG